MLSSAIVNSLINYSVAKKLKSTGYRAFAVRSFVSTGIAQFIDNLVFALIVSYHFFGWTAVQVFFCSLTGAAMELLCEVIFSPAGYNISCKWEEESVGQQYIEYLSGAARA